MQVRIEGRRQLEQLRLAALAHKSSEDILRHRFPCVRILQHTCKALPPQSALQVLLVWTREGTLCQRKHKVTGALPKQADSSPQAAYI